MLLYLQCRLKEIDNAKSETRHVNESRLRKETEEANARYGFQLCTLTVLEYIAKVQSYIFIPCPSQPINSILDLVERGNEIKMVMEREREQHTHEVEELRNRYIPLST